MMSPSSFAHIDFDVALFPASSSTANARAIAARAVLSMPGIRFASSARSASTAARTDTLTTSASASTHAGPTSPCYTEHAPARCTYCGHGRHAPNPTPRRAQSTHHTSRKAPRPSPHEAQTAPATADANPHTPAPPSHHAPYVQSAPFKPGREKGEWGQVSGVFLKKWLVHGVCACLGLLVPSWGVCAWCVRCAHRRVLMPSLRPPGCVRGSSCGWRDSGAGIATS